ncbi:MAG TPA: YibE/F family protein [Pseudogracilibacillus sp.]|nr:YibE/F family protein [Pseudogracilibacillus sp.]
MNKQQIIVLSIMIVAFIGSIIFVNNNYSFYSTPIVKVTHTELIEQTDTVDNFNNQDIFSTQKLTAEIMNGEYVGDTIELMNDYSIAGAYDQAYTPGSELFVSLSKSEEPLTGYVTNIKRDKYIIYIAWIFILTLVLIGKRQGFFAVISLAINALVLSFALDIYINYNNINLLLVISLCVIIFTVSSLLLVNGRNEKTYAAIVASLLGTFISVLIAYLVLVLTNEEGLRYEAMDFLTRPYKLVFMAGVFVGSLGAVMDVAITMSASTFELHEKNNNISNTALKKSVMDIGKDIMGTMTNILFFAYLSGSIPIMLLYLKNGSPLFFTISMNLSLEIARALAGGIGIVLTIPIGLYVSLFFLNRKKAKL